MTKPYFNKRMYVAWLKSMNPRKMPCRGSRRCPVAVFLDEKHPENFHLVSHTHFKGYSKTDHSLKVFIQLGRWAYSYLMAVDKSIGALEDWSKLTAGKLLELLERSK